MKSLKIPMTVDEYHLMQWKFGWKDEYWDGAARITPRHNGIFVKTLVELRKIETQINIQPLSVASFEDLCELFYVAFTDSVEYCDYKKAQIKSASEKNIRHFFDGKRGIPQLELSRVAVLSKYKKPLAGVCLVTKYKYGYKNEILFVHPKRQNKNIETTLVTSLLNDLHKRGETALWSEYQICNEPSAAWHKKFGFTEEPDILITRLRLNYLRHEIWRLNKIGESEKAEELKSLLKTTETRLELLSELENLDFRAAHSFWRNDF